MVAAEAPDLLGGSFFQCKPCPTPHAHYIEVYLRVHMNVNELTPLSCLKQDNAHTLLGADEALSE